MSGTVGVGLVGLGTVGSAVAGRLLGAWELLSARAGATPVLRRVAVRDPNRQRSVDLRRVPVDSDPEALVDDPGVNIVVEVMGGVDRATALMERALVAGKAVVTANKAALAAHGPELQALAAEHGTSLRYEAAAGAGLPVVALLRDSLRGDHVISLEMIINGTTNVILSAMERDGSSLDAALATAQRLGYAEADPSADVDGFDAAAKLTLLSRLAFESPFSVDDVFVTGIRAVEAADIACARSLGGSVKLVARARRGAGGVSLRVEPSIVFPGHPLHGVDDGENSVVVSGDLAGTIVLRGPGAGGASTASAVVADVVAAVSEPGRVFSAVDAGLAAAADESERRWYLRLALRPIADSAELAVQALEDRGVAVEASTTLPGGTAGSLRQLAVLCGTVTADVAGRAAETLDSLSAVDSVAALMPCLEGA